MTKMMKKAFLFIFILSFTFPTWAEDVANDEAVARAKYWSKRGFQFDPKTTPAWMMDSKVKDYERAKYWESKGYHFDVRPLLRG